MLVPKTSCLLGCGWNDDAVLHYCCCSVYWRFLAERLRVQVSRSREHAFMVAKGMSEDCIKQLAIGLYSLFRT
eukprot:1392220-Karenia_brevis.AAC.1